MLSICDDRDRPVRLHPLALAAAAHPRHIRRPASGWTVAALRAAFRPGVFLAAAAAAFVAVLASLLTADTGLALAMLFYSPVLAPLFMTALIAGRALTDLPDLAATAAQRAALADRRCPSCWYDLGGLEPADDNRIECPECAAAWDGAKVGAAECQHQEVVVIAK